MGTDYEASAQSFTFEEGSMTSSIVITTKKLGTDKTVSLSLQLPEGFIAGKYTTSQFTLQDKYGYLSFESERSFMADTTNYTITLSDSTGRSKALSKEVAVSFSVDQEKSTAEEGVDFEFVTTSSVCFAAGSSYASFSIAPIGSTPREGKDKIVLNVCADEKFNTGKMPQMEISLLRSELKSLNGKWQIDTLVTDSLHFENIWGAECSGYSMVPEFSASDGFDISFAQRLFTPYFRSGLKHYFIGKSNMDFGGEMQITDTKGNPKTVQLISLDKTNRYFSEQETSADSLSYIGIHLYQETAGESAKDMMELYILDHTSKSFMPELESAGRYGTEKPVAADPKLFLCATFSK